MWHFQYMASLFTCWKFIFHSCFRTELFGSVQPLSHFAVLYLKLIFQSSLNPFLIITRRWWKIKQRCLLFMKWATTEMRMSLKITALIMAKTCKHTKWRVERNLGDSTVWITNRPSIIYTSKCAEYIVYILLKGQLHQFSADFLWD